MKWILTRKHYRPDGIFGELVSEDGKYYFVTLERAYKVEDESHPDSVEYVPKIQEGIRPVVKYASPKQGMFVPLLDGPEDRGRYFQIHIGNYHEDSDGCILIGRGIGNRSNGGKMITNSKRSFDELMKLGIQELEVRGAV